MSSTPEIRIYTPEQVRWVRSFATRVNGVLVAWFRPEPDSRPTIYVRDLSLLSSRRMDASVCYLDTLISKHLLHRDYYHAHTPLIPSNDGELFCVMQIDDEALDLDKSIGYCANGPHLTLIPDAQFWIYRGYFDQRQEITKTWVPWEDRVSRVFWRGSSTGAHAITLASLENLPRFRLCGIGANNKALRGVLDAKLTNIVQVSNAEEFAKIRAYLESGGLLSAHVPQMQFLKYRFQIDIDGNSNSWSLLLKLLMGACVLKVMSAWRQWYYSDIQAWEHYVPIKNDLSDLEEQVAWCLDHDEQAREIATNGMRFANGLVFGREMTRAAGLIAQASRNSAYPLV